MVVNQISFIPIQVQCQYLSTLLNFILYSCYFMCLSLLQKSYYQYKIQKYIITAHKLKEMIMQQRTRIYTNSNGQYEKVDVFKSYRKINVVPTILDQPANKQELSGFRYTCFALLRAFVIVMSLFGLVSVVFYGFQRYFSQQERIQFDFGEQNEQYSENCLSIADFEQFLKSSAKQITINEYFSTKPRIMGNQIQYFSNQLIQRLKCSWMSNKIHCQFSEVTTVQY